MRNLQFYDELSILNDNLYNKTIDYKNFVLLDTYSDNTGLFVALYKTNNEIIFAIKGSEILPRFDFKDYVRDGLILSTEQRIKQIFY